MQLSSYIFELLCSAMWVRAISDEMSLFTTSMTCEIPFVVFVVVFYTTSEVREFSLELFEFTSTVLLLLPLITFIFDIPFSVVSVFVEVVVFVISGECE